MPHRIRFTRATFVLICLCIVSTASSTTRSNRPSDPAEIDFATIRTFAVLADAAYTTPSRISEQISLAHYTLGHYNVIPDIEMSYFLATDDASKTQVIAVRGTSNIENALVDLELKLVTDNHADTRLHSGFARAAEAIYTDIKNHLKKDYTISTTGHSLGGAVALILALYLDLDDYAIEQVITFGQPKVTNISGSAKFDHLDVVRVVTPEDVVPLVPPLDPMDINNLDIYWHTGREIILLDGATYAITEGLSSMLRATRFTQQVPDETNLKQHQMNQYLQLLEKKIPNARQVPFKNSLNLFNLFGSGPNQTESNL